MARLRYPEDQEMPRVLMANQRPVAWEVCAGGTTQTYLYCYQTSIFIGVQNLRARTTRPTSVNSQMSKVRSIQKTEATAGSMDL